ncbi:SpoIIE family protein phosphatase [Akkermansia sp. N21116]|uniref:SpoIIE family protein phosphatase n=1 Tax=Akkermansia sp. N21116 TaxID=3040764 RepID=UPI00244EC6D9|nr:SpoIIE family protein phosphatase [Akkermansia sp. N21116]WPX39786.1 SpoIIE family protein phosphatase [Akkermansia sp. N21116]
MVIIDRFRKAIKRSFVLKLNMGIMGIILVCFVAIAVILGKQSASQMEKTQMEHGILAVNRAASKIDMLMVHTENIAKINAAYIEAVKDPELRYKLVQRIVFRGITPFIKSDPCITGAGAALNPNFEEGSKLPCYNFFYNSITDKHESTKEIPQDVYTHSRWFIKAEAPDAKPFWIRPESFPETSAKKSTILYVVPMYERENKTFIGCLFIELTLREIEKALDNIHMDGTGFCFICDRDGNYIMHPSRNVEQNGNIAQHFGFSINETEKKEMIQNIRDGNECAFHLPISSVYKHGEFIFITPCENGWSMGFAVSGDMIWNKTKQLILLVGLFSLITGTTVCLLVYFFTKKYSKSLIALSKAVKDIGEGKFTVPIPKYKDKDEIGLLTRTFSNMQMELLSYLHEQELNIIAKQDYQTDLSVAKKIQMSILPKLTHEFTRDHNFRIGATLMTAKGVGGDLYDFFMADKNHLVLIIGDVCGKGIPAALFMAVTQTLQRGIAVPTKRVDKIVTELNTILYNNNDANMFVTYFCAIMDIRTGRISYCNAGHNPPFIRKESGDLIELSVRNGLPIAIFPQTYTYSETVLNPGDTLILYTDGVTEAFNPDQELFGEIRLKQAIACAMSSEPSFIIDTIIRHMNQFVRDYEQSDDITILAVTRTQEP